MGIVLASKTAAKTGKAPRRWPVLHWRMSCLHLLFGERVADRHAMSITVRIRIRAFPRACPSISESNRPFALEIVVVAVRRRHPEVGKVTVTTRGPDMSSDTRTAMIHAISFATKIQPDGSRQC